MQIPAPSEGGAAVYPPRLPPLPGPIPTHILSAVTPYRSQPVTSRNPRGQPKEPSTLSKRPVDLESHITTEAGHLLRRFLNPHPTVSEMLDIADSLILFAGLADLGSGQVRTKDAMKGFNETYRETCEGEWYQFYETFDEYMHVKSLPINIRQMLWAELRKNGLGSPPRRIPVPEHIQGPQCGACMEEPDQDSQDFLLKYPVNEVKNGDANDDGFVKRETNIKDEPDVKGQLIKRERQPHCDTSHVQRSSMSPESQHTDRTARKRKFAED
ncbi:hypothetical protein BZA77DRAFT_302755 [Pyronema omphalodes]|nr:hypothetical protein BZA77DRAFT_302755 [Pyronema omphalodes]